MIGPFYGARFARLNGLRPFFLLSIIVAVIVMVDATIYGIVIVSGIGIVIVSIMFALLLLSYHIVFITIIISIVVIIMTIIIIINELFTVIEEYECV